MFGHFTHFFPNNCHAVDFECEVGTPVVAISDGIIKEINQIN